MGRDETKTNCKENQLCENYKQALKLIVAARKKHANTQQSTPYLQLFHAYALRGLDRIDDAMFEANRLVFTVFSMNFEQRRRLYSLLLSLRAAATGFHGQ